MITKVKCYDCGLLYEQTLDNFHWDASASRWRTKCKYCVKKHARAKKTEQASKPKRQEHPDYWNINNSADYMW